MDFVMLLLFTLFIVSIGKNCINYISNWIYIRYMRPLKIEDARIAEEDQLLDDADASSDAEDEDGVEAFIDYSRNNQSDEDDNYDYDNDYNFSVNGNDSYSGPDYNFNDGDW